MSVFLPFFVTMSVKADVFRILLLYKHVVKTGCSVYKEIKTSPAKLKVSVPAAKQILSEKKSY